MQEVPHPSLSVTATRQPTQYQNPRWCALPSYRSRFCRPYQIPIQTEDRKQSLPGAVCMQFDEGSVSRPGEIPGDRRIHRKRFIARRGRPGLIYSGNGGTFKAAAKWLKTTQTSEKFNDYLAQYSIQWKFNLSRAPWWGGQFERLIGLFKNAFYKSIGKKPCDGRN